MVYESIEIEKTMYVLTDDAHGTRLVFKKPNGAFVAVQIQDVFGDTNQINYRGAWATNTNYTKNDVVTYNGGFYLAPSSFVSGSTFVKANWIELVPQSGTYGTVLPGTGSFTYDTNGNVLTDPDGNTYTWNADGTPATQTKGGVTRTYHWNADGTLGSVS